MNILKLSARQCRTYIKAAEADAEDLKAQIRAEGRQSMYRNELHGRLENRLLIVKALERRIEELNDLSKLPTCPIPMIPGI